MNTQNILLYVILILGTMGALYMVLNIVTAGIYLILCATIVIVLLLSTEE